MCNECKKECIGTTPCKECVVSVKAKSNIIDLKLENCYQADVLEKLQQNNLLLILSFEKEKCKRIVLTEAQ